MGPIRALFSGYSRFRGHPHSGWGGCAVDRDFHCYSGPGPPGRRLRGRGVADRQPVPLPAGAERRTCDAGEVYGKWPWQAVAALVRTLRPTDSIRARSLAHPDAAQDSRVLRGGAGSADSLLSGGHPVRPHHPLFRTCLSRPALRPANAAVSENALGICAADCAAAVRPLVVATALDRQPQTGGSVSGERRGPMRAMASRSSKSEWRPFYFGSFSRLALATGFPAAAAFSYRRR